MPDDQTWCVIESNIVLFERAKLPPERIRAILVLHHAVSCLGSCSETERLLGLNVSVNKKK